MNHFIEQEYLTNLLADLNTAIDEKNYQEAFKLDRLLVSENYHLAPRESEAFKTALRFTKFMLSQFKAKPINKPINKPKRQFMSRADRHDSRKRQLIEMDLGIDRYSRSGKPWD